MAKRNAAKRWANMREQNPFSDDKRASKEWKPSADDYVRRVLFVHRDGMFEDGLAVAKLLELEVSELDAGVKAEVDFLAIQHDLQFSQLTNSAWRPAR